MVGSTWNYNQCFEIWVGPLLELLAVQQPGSNSLNSASDGVNLSRLFDLTKFIVWNF